MRFVVDCMLGKLSKWLKILGFDTVYFPKIEDEDLLALAKAERRILLTRDTGLIHKAGKGKALFIRSEAWREQIRQVMDDLNARHLASPHSRCIECNTLLKSLPKERAKNLVSPFIYGRSEEFSLCPDCGRVFWKGTHLDDMNKKVDDILKKGN